MTIKKHIPNFITSLNLLCGCIGVVVVFKGFDLRHATYLIWMAAIFDFLDGLVARATKSFSAIGKELDSLADMVTFGVLPAVIMFTLLERAQTPSLFPYFAFLLAVCSALRLAKFNVDERQSESFYGLPTPANALFISGLPFLSLNHSPFLKEFITNPYSLLSITLVFSYFMVMDMELLALKFKDTSWANNKMKYILVIASVFLFIVLKFEAIPLVILLYILLSIVDKYLLK
ncbi:CDP-diacylglycerol--serine O-phosphatidyltransferase [Xanthovirga aplysinae]|uniref:CDP-diacylglycerol--serine O-phosphatidyltransferase n=1 Tax=Xanthovirga aplysinae TaxID=2529853 RepID=UPI0012BC0780|nr:CDP-diacylglycerol--serine O-phosphatidyltransferase [Xanthovirga aplysinae]MTI32592.1 CDP-diacylglycerol--serine O-phosphatidyltransferase [Xanthovirga aplysinae]